MRDTSPLRRSGLVAVAASVAFQLLMIAAILLRPEIDPARKPISEYTIGRLGWLTVLGFQASAVAYASLAAALRHQLRDHLVRMALFLLCYCALATAVVGLCVADPVTTPMSELTARGRVHLLAGVSAFVVLPVAAVAINISLSRTVAWAGSRMLLILTGLLPTIGLAMASGMIKPWMERRCAGSSRRRRSAALRRFAATDARMSYPSVS